MSAVGNRTPGGTLGCRQRPHFAEGLGFTAQSALSTGEGKLKGLVLVDVADTSHTYQHATWSGHGEFGPITYDADGNVYVAPTPGISLLDNQPEQQNTIYKVDTDSGELEEFLKLPGAAPVSPQNPFGILGLTYDCDTTSLYAVSVAGSTRHHEAGQIVRIDPASGSVVDSLPNTDAIGAAILNDASGGKRLYFGSARRPEVRSVALDARGDFDGTPRVELKIPGLTENARRISFGDDGAMTILAVPFAFNLVATTSEMQSMYRFNYDRVSDTWSGQETP